MQLISPTKKYEQSWREALLELETEGTGGFWNIPEKPADIEEYIERTRNHSKGINIPDYWAPATTYWLIDEGRFVGHVNIRHSLNEKLEKKGGHVGYTIRSSARRNGYGMKILELALLKAREIGLKKVLVTCDDKNIASIKIVEKNGGILQDKIEVEGMLVRRYWIEN
ncbi:MAG: GNAT family N-acetyltransferase [Patescibacteria group bacterium]